MAFLSIKNIHRASQSMKSPRHFHIID